MTSPCPVCGEEDCRWQIGANPATTAAHVVETGKRLVDVDCADTLVATNVHRIRLDTGEVIETRAATPDELQQALPFGNGKRERAEKTEG